jgi:N-acetylmuramoyl-L-alanine amidase
MKRNYFVFLFLTIFFTSFLISGTDDCEKRSCFKRIKDALDATYIVIDPGHGGACKYRGATAVDGTPEKTLNLNLAKDLRNRLIALGIKNIKLTREVEKDQEVGEKITEMRKYLEDSKENFKKECADFYPIFISIHFNGEKNQDVNGTEEYYGYNGYKNWLPGCIHNKLIKYFKNRAVKDGSKKIIG